MGLDAATVLLQWAGGGLFFLWVTTRHREVGIGYGWLLRAVYGLMAAAAFAVGVGFESQPVRDVAALTVAVLATVPLTVSIIRRRAGVAGERARVERRTARVAAMTGIERQGAAPASGEAEFPPRLDLVPVVPAVVGLVAAGGLDVLDTARLLVGAAFLGAVSDAMLLGHWYLVQPGLGRGPIHELNAWLARLWPAEVGLLLVPTGMVSVFTGGIDDGYGGLLGWFWGACALTTLILSFVTRAALRERAYAAVMAATGLLYLAILTAFGTDLIARALIA
jgi:hypothetical protein